MKKIIIGLMFGLFVLSSIACNPGSKAMKAIEGKEGIFAIMDTSKGEICLKLYYDKNVYFLLQCIDDIFDIYSPYTTYQESNLDDIHRLMY